MNQVQATAILDPSNGYIANNAKEIVKNGNNRLKVTQIGWLSQVGTEKLYESMVISLAEKKDMDLLVFNGLIEIGRKTANTEAF